MVMTTTAITKDLVFSDKSNDLSWITTVNVIAMIIVTTQYNVFIRHNVLGVTKQVQNIFINPRYFKITNNTYIFRTYFVQFFLLKYLSIKFN